MCADHCAVCSCPSQYYEEVSVSIDSDDYFGTMLAGTWAHIKKKTPNGATEPVVKFTNKKDVELLEALLRKQMFSKVCATCARRDGAAGRRCGCVSVGLAARCGGRVRGMAPRRRGGREGRQGGLCIGRGMGLVEGTLWGVTGA